MKFGKLNDVENVNWRIPEDDPLAEVLLARQSSIADLKIYFGAPAWGHASWIGKIYPATAKRSEFLSYYSKNFNCIELNTSHYRIPSDEQVQLWTNQVPSEFLFCPKVFQGISHARNGLRDRKLLSEWLHFSEKLGNHYGPCFLQLPPHFSYSYKPELFDLLKQWPNEFPLALEFRHPTWFQNGKIIPALTQYLQGRGIGLVITDVAGRRDVLHGSISADFTLLRFVGNNLHASDYVRATAWSERFVKWRDMGLKRLFLFIHEPDDILVPEMTDFFLERLFESGGWHFTRSRPTDSQTSFTFS